jgi:alkaline phosphatase D
VYADDVKRIHWTKKDTAENARWWWSSFLENRRKVAYATPDCFRRIYAAQLKVPEYRQMLEDDNGRGKISMFGTIDDHDYGKNNGDKTYPFRCEAGIQFTNFLGLTNETSAMARRAAKGLGVYGVQVYDFSSTTHRLLTDTEAGLDPDVVPEQNDRHRSNDSDEETNQLVAVFVLDVRSNRTPWATTIPERFKVDPDGDFLGEDQWKWFETALGRSNASVNIIVSGVQVHAPWFYDGNRVENWR